MAPLYSFEGFLLYIRDQKAKPELEPTPEPKTRYDAEPDVFFCLFVLLSALGAPELASRYRCEYSPTRKKSAVMMPELRGH